MKSIRNGQFVVNPQFEWTGGGYATSPLDLARWGHELYAGRALSATARKLMIDAAVPARLGPETRYGLGVIVRTDDAGRADVGPQRVLSRLPHRVDPFPGRRRHARDPDQHVRRTRDRDAPAAARPLRHRRDGDANDDDALHRDVPEGRRVPPRVQAAGLPRAAADRRDAARRRLAARRDRRVLLRPPRHAAGRHPQGRRVSSPAPSASIGSSRWTTSTSRPRAMLREYLHVPGMGETTGRAFRDKLAMRVAGPRGGDRLPGLRARRESRRDHTSGPARVAPPWVLKPRSQAAAIGIKKIGIRRGALGDPRRARRRAPGVRARAVRARRRLSRGLARLRSADRVRRGQPLRHAADGGRARGRDLRDAHAGGRPTRWRRG